MRSPTARRAPTTPRATTLFVAFALGGLLPRSARAQDTPPPAAVSTDAPTPEAATVTMTYDLPVACPAAPDFEAAVLTRAPHAQFVADGTRRFRVAAWQDGSEWVGEIAAVPAVDASSVRRVRGATCGDVVSALALIAALALEPGAASEATLGNGAAPVAPTPEPRPEPPPPPPAPPVVIAPMQEPVSAGRGIRWSFAAGASGLVSFGIAPGALFGFGISVDASPARDSILPFIARLSFVDLLPRELGTPLKARFGGQFISLEGCPVALPLRAIRILPCAGIEGGVLEVGGVPQPALAGTQGETALFLGAVEALRMLFPLSKTFAVELEGTLKEPFRHDSFGYLRPPVPVYTLPVVLGAIGLGLRVNL